MKKYKFTGETEKFYGRTLHRIVALRDFGDVKKGDVGGWIQKHSNLSHEGNCWVYDDSIAFNDAEVRDNAQVKDFSEVRNFAQIFDNAKIKENSVIWDFTRVFDNAIVNNSSIHEHAWIFENAKVLGSVVCEDAMVYGNAKIDNKRIDGGHHVC